MNILETIVEQKRIEVARLPRRSLSLEDLRATVQRHGARRDFMVALRQPRLGSVALIAEVKKASPSAGIICHDFDPVRLAREYQEAGATCLSVLTDEKFFQGSLSYLQEIRQAVDLPVLRKDFIIDERQIIESVESGADAILLIVAILSDAQLSDYRALAEAADLSVLVEVHDEEELDRALAAGAKMIGVNNRNLKTFVVDLTTTERLSAVLKGSPGGFQKLLVSESGIQTRADVERLVRCGAAAILVGESLAKHGDIKAKAAQLLGN